MPTKYPRKEPKVNVRHEWRRLFTVSITPRRVTLAWLTCTPPLVVSMVHRISPIPYIPMASTRKLMPCMKPVISANISRGRPEMISSPTALSTRPKDMAKRVFRMESLPRPMKVAKAITIRANSSGGPNFKAKSARGGANRVNSSTDTVPPKNEAEAAAISALSASPFRAMGRPSKVVATAVEAPGMPSMMELIAPPYMAP